MTAKTVEEILLNHTRSVASLDTYQAILSKEVADQESSNSKRFDDVSKSIDDLWTDSADLKLRLALAEKEITDLKALLERGRGFRSTLTITFISAIVSAICSATVAYYVRPK